MNYNDKLWNVKQFIEENFDDPVELTIALGLSVDDIVLLLPDVLVANYHKFFQTNEDTDDDIEEEDVLNYDDETDWDDNYE
jgi:hypothetical protein